MYILELLVNFVCTNGIEKDKFTIMSLGCGTDKGDKGYAKAYSSAFKAALIKTFMLPAGTVDADAESEPREVDTLSIDQATSIRDRIDETGADKATLLDFYKVDDLVSIPAHKYNSVIKWLDNVEQKAGKGK